MIIYTTNESLDALLAGYSQHDGNNGYSMYPLTPQEITRLADALTTKYAGQWLIDFDGHPTVRYEDLTAGVDGANWRAFLLAPGKYGADTEEMIHFIENVYGLPIDNDNHKQVVQMFRLWYAANHPAEYINPPTHRRAVVQKAQTARRNRLTQAANRIGADTIDRLAAAVLALSDEDAATLRACFAELTRKS